MEDESRDGVAGETVAGNADRRLLRHLVVAVVVKLVALLAIWLFWVARFSVSVDAEHASRHVTQTGPGTAVHSGGRP